MTTVQPFRKCEAAGCFRKRKPDSLLCDAHYRLRVETILDSNRVTPVRRDASE